MTTEEYSRIKARELAKKTGDPEVILYSMIQYNHPGKHEIKWALDHRQESWREIKSKKEVDQRFFALESGVSDETDLYFDQMLILFWRAFKGLQKLSIVERNISNEEIDTYAARLSDLYDQMQRKATIQAMKD